MRTISRRSLLSTVGIALPFGLGARAGASAGPVVAAPTLRLRPFEEAVRAAFAGQGGNSSCDQDGDDRALPRRRVEVGHSEEVRSGVQGCHNDRPFAGFPAGHLRIVQAGSEPGPVRQGVRLWICTVDVVLTGGGLPPDVPSRPLDFASLPPAPTFS